MKQRPLYTILSEILEGLQVPSSRKTYYLSTAYAPYMELMERLKIDVGKKLYTALALETKLKEEFEPKLSPSVGTTSVSDVTQVTAVVYPPPGYDYNDYC